MLDIAFVSYQKNTLLRNVLLMSSSQVVIALIDCRLVRKIKYTYATLRTLIIGSREGSKFLLARSVPDLKVIGLLINDRGIGLKIDANS